MLQQNFITGLELGKLKNNVLHVRVSTGFKIYDALKEALALSASKALDIHVLANDRVIVLKPTMKGVDVEEAYKKYITGEDQTFVENSEAMNWQLQ